MLVYDSILLLNFKKKTVFVDYSKYESMNTFVCNENDNVADETKSSSITIHKVLRQVGFHIKFSRYLLRMLIFKLYSVGIY